jgi:FtsP/CotA-like multicopper oxidase with cupredoxin domain
MTMQAWKRGATATGPCERACMLFATAAIAAAALWPVTAVAQGNLQPTNPNVTCPDPISQNLVMPPEIVSGSDHILKGTIILAEETQRLPTSIKGVVTCAPQIVRTFRAAGAPPTPPAQPPAPGMTDPIPGPTLRAKVGDLVQLGFVNQINSNRFDRNIDIDACTNVGAGGAVYPARVKDEFPNCLHASSTGNIHYHGTHTNPNSTGDNVFLQIRPLPRNNQGALTTTAEQAMVGFDDFFKTCAEKLKTPLSEWPFTWSDMPQSWVNKQSELLMAYQRQNPSQPLWDLDRAELASGWPQYYIGAVPYCFALPAYTADIFPPPPNSNSPIMGQAPGTHWYHAHKHGSTAINVANGMTGAFIIEGQYDEDLNTAYGKYLLKDNKPWTTRAQPVMVLNQLATTFNLLAPGGTGGIDFEVNGRLRPIVQMQQGEIQLWRIVNTSSRNAAYFMAPKDIAWRQIAQDGVQFSNASYQNDQDHPFYLAPGNRVDLLVQAPMRDVKSDILIQMVMGRAQVLPTPVNPTTSDPNPGTPLMSVNVSGPPVTLNGRPAQMQFLDRPPEQPKFLADVTAAELLSNNDTRRRLTFNSKPPRSAEQQTINDLQFEDRHTDVYVMLNTAEEWTIANSTASTSPGIIDHPFHIHVNPFQITEVFDPNEHLTDPKTGQLIGVLVNGKTQPVPKYVLDKSQVTDPARQCVLDVNDPDTWKPCHPGAPQPGLIWWDVFAIPSGRTEGSKANTSGSVTIPGYFRMRSRFVDYPGFYVLHCHILVHEDRGMMFTVEVLKPQPIPVHH